MVIEFGEEKISKAMLCPHCTVPLSMASRQNIEIDYCPQCRGVWLDRGELDKIIERSVAEHAPAPQPAPHPAQQPATTYRDDRSRRRDHRDRYDRDDDRYDDRKRKKKKSWLYEIFDELT